MQYNFSSISNLDNFVFASCRPGPWPCEDQTPETRIKEGSIGAWIEFVKEKGITHIVSLLAPDELASYSCSIGSLITSSGLNYTNVHIRSSGAFDSTMAAIDLAVKAGGKCLIHCWGGGGRAGRVAASWLVYKHSMSYSTAATTINTMATTLGVNRRADEKTLEAFITAPKNSDDIMWKSYRLTSPALIESDWVKSLDLSSASSFTPINKELVQTESNGAAAEAEAKGGAATYTQLSHAPRILLLYGSLRTTSYSRLLCYEFARILESMGADCRCFDPHDLPQHDTEKHSTHPKVVELRKLSEWSEGQVWVSPEQHGAITGLMKSQLDWIPLALGSVRPTQGRTLAVAEVSGGSQSFNAVNTLRLLGRWMRMICIPNQSSVPMAWTQFDENGRMKAGDLRSRVVDVAEELFRFTILTRPFALELVDRYSEREEKKLKGRLQSQAEKVAEKVAEK
jgi:arsenical resistance protein ArsH